MKRLLLIAALSLGIAQGSAVGYSNDCSSCCSNYFDGFYLGGHVGWGFQQKVWVDRDCWVDNFSQDWALGSVYTTNDGVLAGLQGGYNYLCGCALLGVEADGSWADFEKTKHYSPTSDGTTSRTDLFIRDRSHWLGTIRARAGIVANDLLLYVTGGVAIAGLESRWTLVDVNSTESFKGNNTRWGLALGTGAEWAFCDWVSLKAEGMFLKFPEKTYAYLSPAGAQVVYFDIQNENWIARIGLNVKLDCFCR